VLSPFAGRTIAVTGAAGFLGGRVVSRLGAADCTIIRVARGTQLPLDFAPIATIVDVCGDVRDRDTWNRLAGADVIFHFAAQTSAAAAAVDPDGDFTANVMPMRHLLAACRERERRPTAVFAGTVTQAGIPSRVPVDESVPDHPVTSYDRHKLMAEVELKLAAAAGVVSGVSLRLANVYGPGAPGKADRGVLNRMIAAALRGEPLTVFGTGGYVRDYVFIEDVVDAFLTAASRPERVNGTHYVIGSGRGTSVRGAFELVAARVELRTGVRVPVVTVDPAAPLSPIDQRDFVADPSRFSKDTGWRPSVSLLDGIDRTIEALA
jgi:UDP-glucose 4-epimerase